MLTEYNESKTSRVNQRQSNRTEEAVKGTVKRERLPRATKDMMLWRAMLDSIFKEYHLEWKKNKNKNPVRTSKRSKNLRL